MVAKFISASVLVLFALTVMPAAFAQEAISTTSASPVAVDTAKLACVRTAVEKRETALIAALDSFYSAAKAVFETRKTELSAVWSITDGKERRKARNAAWQKFSKTYKEALKTHRNTRKDIWKTFEQEAKDCGLPETSEPKGRDLSI